MKENFNAEEMHKLANALCPPIEACDKAPNSSLGAVINRSIKERARLGGNCISYAEEDKIDYILSHREEYIKLGFSITKSSIYGFPMVIIFW